MITRLEEALIIFAEECAEAQKAVAKIQRFGLESRYPADGKSNLEKLINEMGDVRAASALVADALAVGGQDPQAEYNLSVAEAKKMRDYACGEFLQNKLCKGHWMTYVTAN